MCRHDPNIFMVAPHFDRQSTASPGSRNRLIFRTPWGEVIHIAISEINFQRTLFTRTPPILESFIVAPLGQSPSPLQENNIHHDSYDCGLLSYYFSYISGIYFPNMDVQKSLLVILILIFSFHLYKGRSPITKIYAQ